MAKDDDILKDAIERFKESQDGTDFNREAAESDIRFARLGDQWPDKVKRERQAEGRPCLTINKLPSFIRQVVNDARQSKPGVIAHPVDSGADVDTANIITGLIRSIERASHADVAYDTAIEHAVTCGFGFFQIGTEYAHDDSFDQEIRVHRVANPLMVNWDPNSVEFDASDWEYAFVSDFYTEEQFKKRWSDAGMVSFEGDSRSAVNLWLQNDSVRVADYWLKEEKTEKLLLVQGLLDPMGGPLPPQPMRKSDLEGNEWASFLLETGQLEVVRERDIQVCKIKKRIISGAEVLEEEDWLGSMIPICPVYGEEVVIDGRRYFRSMIADARDPQKMFNFWRSATTELVALAPKAPWLVHQSAIPAGREAEWETANNRSHPYLMWQGQVKPERQPFAGVPAGALQEAMSASDDIKSVTGIYDASLGARSNETSGRAIFARQRESDVSNFHFIDNRNRAIEYAGRIMVELIPHIYGARDAIQILGEDMTEDVIRLSTESGGGELNEEGEQKLYDISVGKYDVTVKAGPSYATQREEARETLIELIRAVPGAAPILGDVLMEHLDFQGSGKVAERLKHLLPAPIKAAEGIPMMAGPEMAPGMQPGQVPRDDGGMNV